VSKRCSQFRCPAQIVCEYGVGNYTPRRSHCQSCGKKSLALEYKTGMQDIEITNFNSVAKLRSGAHITAPLTPGTPLYLGNSGVLTFNPPSTGHGIVVGVAGSSTPDEYLLVYKDLAQCGEWVEVVFIKMCAECEQCEDNLSVNL